MTESSLRYAKDAFSIEAKAILECGERMDWTSFAKAVAVLSQAQRIATCGCGHTGIACMHFAHSLCCVERPARFLSPSEAAHGAAGFLQKGDVLIFASRGGKTIELFPLIAIAKQKECAVISVVGDLSSLLAKESDIVLPMAIHKEADKYNTQSTSSFAGLCAIFDALQVAIMEETGFQKEQFALIHPGGAVGERLNTVQKNNF